MTESREEKEQSLAHMNGENDRRFSALVRIVPALIRDNLIGAELSADSATDTENRIIGIDVGAFSGVITRAVEEELRAFGVQIDIIGVDPLYHTSALPSELLTPSTNENMSGINGYVGGKGERLPFATNSVDVITAIDSIHHSEYPFDVIREMWRVLKEGGVMVIKDHDPETSARFILAATADITGNTSRLSDQAAQMIRLFGMILRRGAEDLKAHYNKPYEELPQKQFQVQGPSTGDTHIAFNYIGHDQWQDIFRELGASAQEIDFACDFLPLGRTELDVDQGLWVLRKPNQKTEKLPQT